MRQNASNDARKYSPIQVTVVCLLLCIAWEQAQVWRSREKDVDLASFVARMSPERGPACRSKTVDGRLPHHSSLYRVSWRPKYGLQGRLNAVTQSWGDVLCRPGGYCVHTMHTRPVFCILRLQCLLTCRRWVWTWLKTAFTRRRCRKHRLLGKGRVNSELTLRSSDLF